MKGKPSWAITRYPFDIKVKIWEAMRQGSSFSGTQKYIARHPDLFTDVEYKALGIDPKSLNNKVKNEVGFLFSRDTYKALLSELKMMPLREITQLPNDIQHLARNLKGDILLTESIDNILKKWEDHNNNLSVAAIRLVDNLTPYLLVNEGHLEDYVVGTQLEEDKDFEAQLVDIPTRWLLRHMSTDFPFLKNLDSWGNVLTKDITEKLLRTIREKAAQRDFPGRCETCKKWIK